MKKLAKKPTTTCPIARSLDVVGDRWTMLILRELCMGATRFEEIQMQTEATPQMLATRLKALEANGMVTRRPYSQKPLRYEYVLTEKGKAFYPVIYSLRAWGEIWCKSKGEDIAMHFTHRTCGRDIGLGNVCPDCGTVVARDELVPSLSPSFAEERKEKKIAFKGTSD